MLLYQDLRTTYPEFLYKGYQIEEDDTKVCIQYQFEITGLSVFTPSWEFPKEKAEKKWGTDPCFMNLVFSLGMAELVSYWKITCSPTVKILCGTLGKEQIRWWKKLYFNGLGEFYYTNGITAEQDTFMTMTANENIEPIQILCNKELKGCLIPIGGGKDSAVTLELLKEQKESNVCYIINPRGATLDTVKAGGYEKHQVISVKRTLDSRMIHLNQQGFLNGHTPFSAIVAFSSTIAAYMRGLRFIVLSNEASANESTIEGSYVNHQYSKSYEFEQDFHQYEEENLKTGTYYFSLLRPLSEFQIAAYFAKCTPYHDIFRSCNAGSKENIWCGHCPKCLFVTIILSPFLEQNHLKEIFGRELLNDKELNVYFEQLIGLEKEKPFECVGSRDEVNKALVLTIEHLEEQGVNLPYLLEFYKTTQLYQKYQQDKDYYFTYFNEEHMLPPEFIALVKTQCGIKNC